MQHQVDDTVIVEPGAAVMEGATVGPGCRIGANSVVGPGVQVGANTILWYNVSLRNCVVGSDCVFHNGVSVGQDGFGFYVDKDTGKVIKKPQV